MCKGKGTDLGTWSQGMLSLGDENSRGPRGEEPSMSPSWDYLCVAVVAFWVGGSGGRLVEEPWGIAGDTTG